MIVVDQHELAVFDVDMIGNLDEGCLRRHHDADGLGDGSTFVLDHAEEGVRGTRRVAIEDRAGERVKGFVLTQRVGGLQHGALPLGCGEWIFLKAEG